MIVNVASQHRGSVWSCQSIFARSTTVLRTDLIPLMPLYIRIRITAMA